MKTPLLILTCVYHELKDTNIICTIESTPGCFDLVQWTRGAPERERTRGDLDRRQGDDAVGRGERSFPEHIIAQQVTMIRVGGGYAVPDTKKLSHTHLEVKQRGPVEDPHGVLGPVPGSWTEA